MKPKRIIMLGATGTIGRATLRKLAERGHKVVAFVRPSRPEPTEIPGVEFRMGEVTNALSIVQAGICDEQFDVMLSCLASRNGTPSDAWQIDYQAHLDALDAAQRSGIGHFVILSAICVQKPRLAFQQAKLAFEKVLIDSGMPYSIVRPTAFFKSLSGQVERVKAGRPFLLFGNGELTACKPISDNDLASYLADCVDDPALQNRILPIGGPGDAITPKQQGDMLFTTLGTTPRFRHVPLGLLDIIISGLTIAGTILPVAKRKAELARIGRYYATESMLLWDGETGRYDAAATPSTGADTLAEHYQRLINGDASVQRGDHSVF